MCRSLVSPRGRALKQEQADREDQRKTLYRALKDATYVLQLRSGPKDLMELLIGHIPNGAPSPVSPASVQLLRDRLSREDRTIRYQIAKLVRLGLIHNRCLANGRRHVHRNRTGEIVHVAGIDLSPLLGRAQEWADRAAAKREDYNQRARLRFQISQKRGTLSRTFHSEEMPADLKKLWSELPRDIAKLSLGALEAIVDKVDQLISAITADRKNMAGQPEDFDRAYTTHQEQSESCKPAIHAEKRDAIQPEAPRTTCGLEHISLKQAILAAPADWQDDMALHGQGTWHGFVGTAYQRAEALGINPSVWAQAQAAIGASGAAVLVMLADANAAERGGAIRSVGGWMRRMSERVEDGDAHLHRSVYGLLHRTSPA